MNAFDLAISFLLRPDIEGEESNDPLDRGGHTRWGISRRAHGRLPRTFDAAVEIYRIRYWNHYKLDRLPTWAGVLLFDCLVNHKPRSAVRLLQRALGTKADGRMGPITIQAAWSADPVPAAEAMLVQRSRLFNQIVKNDRSQLRFINGWQARVIKLSAYIFTKVIPNEMA